MNNLQPALPDAKNTSPLTPPMLARLRAVPILGSLTDSDLHCLDGTRELHLAADDILVKQGELTRKFWILLDGSIRVAVQGPDDREQTLHILEPGSTFGEVPLLAGMPAPANLIALAPTHLLELSEDQFWTLLTRCPIVRKEILGNMALRLAKMQSVTFQQEKMAALGTMAAGLMHELNNPGTAARHAASQLRENLVRMQHLTARFTRTSLNDEQKRCIFELQELALSAPACPVFHSIEQADAEEALTHWMEAAHLKDAWKLAPTFASVGIDAQTLACALNTFEADIFADALSWLEALVSSMQLVGTIEESIGRVGDLVKAVKSYAYESRDTNQTIDLNRSIEATLVILGHKLREKQITIEKDFAVDLPLLQTACSGLNQVWTNLLDNAVDAAPQQGRVRVKTWAETLPGTPGDSRHQLCIMVSDNGSGIPLECQPHIFDPFFTTKEAGVGTGLGLGIVYRIVEQCGGVIHFSSTAGQTEFVVRLPAQSQGNRI